MNVYITKINGLPAQDTSQYVQRMTAEIGHQLGFREMGLYHYNRAGESNESLNARLDGIISGIVWGNDIVICQFPTGNGFKYEWELVKRLRMYQSRVIIFIHNVGNVVQKDNRVILEETIRLYNQAEVLIIPSLEMRQFLLDNGIKKDMKFVILEMWDFITDSNFYSFPQFRKEIHFAGGSSFEGMHNWKDTFPLKVYAELSFSELLFALSKGGFGLVWQKDEESYQCMKYDVSFLLSRYLAAGIPVIVPVGISNQTLIEKNHLGLIVNSLDEAIEAIESMKKSEYQDYIRCVGQFAPALRSGYYSKKCMIEAVQAVCRKDAGEITTPAYTYKIEDQAFTYVMLKESYGGNLALSWSYSGDLSGFQIYDITGKLVYETRDLYQHYCLIKGYGRESGFVIKAYVDTLKGKMIIAETTQTYIQEKQYDHIDVSMIIPIYNAQDYIVRGIDVVLAQSFSGLEIILVDDGSTDNTSNVIDWYAEKYSNVIAIHQENGGVGAARNRGIRCAQGEYIGFMDSDDMIYPDMVARLYNYAKKNDCDVAITSARKIKKNGYGIYVQYSMENYAVVSAEEFVHIHFNKDVIFAVEVWNKLYRATLIKERLFPEILLGEDAAWTPYVLSYAKRICYIDEFLYEYDRATHEGTLGSQWLYKAKGERFEMYKNIVRFYLKAGNPERRETLKMYAKRFLQMWSQVYDDVAYLKLCEEVDKMF